MKINNNKRYALINYEAINKAYIGILLINVLNK